MGTMLTLLWCQMNWMKFMLEIRQFQAQQRFELYILEFLTAGKCVSGREAQKKNQFLEMMTVATG